MKQRQGTPSAALLAALVLSACGGDGAPPFNPLGSDVSLGASWTVEGQVPDLTTCGEVDRVRLQVCGNSQPSSCRGVGLEFDCVDGGFDTRPQPILAHGDYFTRWQTVRASGAIMESTPLLGLDVTVNTHATLATPDFDMGFVPTGDDVSLSGTWTVDGLTPSVAVCGDITDVVLEVCETASATSCRDIGLEFPCADGAFDTSPMAVLAAGDYFARWIARSGGGTFSASATFSLDATTLSHVVVDTPDFDTPFDPSGTDVSLSGDWDVNAGIPTIRKCGDITTVRLLVCEDAGATECVDLGLEFPCVDGTFDTQPSAVLALGNYFTVWQTLNDSGDIIEETTALPLDASVAGHVVLATPDFTGAFVTDLTAFIGFETMLMGGMFASCTDAGILSGEFEYSLHDGTMITDPAIVAATTQLCSAGNDVSFTETAQFTFDAGDYTLFVTASENDNGTITTWDGSCTFQLTLGLCNEVVCDIPITSVSP